MPILILAVATVILSISVLAVVLSLLYSFKAQKDYIDESLRVLTEHHSYLLEITTDRSSCPLYTAQEDLNGTKDSS